MTEDGYRVKLRDSKPKKGESPEQFVVRMQTKNVPNLPAFLDGKDNLDSYLQRFERFATSNDWQKETWAPSLCALLIGKALDVYSRLSVEAAADYD